MSVWVRRDAELARRDLLKGTREVTFTRELELGVFCHAHEAAVPSTGYEPDSQPQVTRREGWAPCQLRWLTSRLAGFGCGMGASPAR